MARLKILLVATAFALLGGYAEAFEPRVQMPLDSGGRQFEALRPSNTQAFGYGASSISSTVLTTDVVRIVCSTACHVAVGELVTATVSSTYLPANTPLTIRVVSGADFLGFIQNASTGIAYITGLK